MLKYFFAINLSILVCFLLFKMYQSKKEPFTTTPPSCDTTCPAEEVKHTLKTGNEQYIKCCPQDQYAQYVATNGELSCTDCPPVDDPKYDTSSSSLTGQIRAFGATGVEFNGYTTIGHCQAKCKNGGTIQNPILHPYDTTKNEYNRGSGSECGSYTNYTPMNSDETIGSNTYHYADYGSSPTQTMKKKTIDYSSGSNGLCPDSQKVSDDYCCISGKEPRKNVNNIKCCNPDEYLDEYNACTPCPGSGQGSYNNVGINACYITGNECIQKGYTVNGGESPEFVLEEASKTTPIYHSSTVSGSYNCKMYECSFDTTTDITPTISDGSPARPLTCTEKMYDSTPLSNTPVSYPDTTGVYTMFYADETTNRNTLQTPIPSKYKNSASVDGEYAKYYLCLADHYLREDEGSSASPTKYGCCPQNYSLSNDQCINLSNDPIKAIADNALKEGDRTGDCLPYYYQANPNSVCTKCEDSKYSDNNTPNDIMWEKLDNVELDTTKISSMELSLDTGISLQDCKKKCFDNNLTSNTKDCRLIEFTPETKTCKLYDLPQPTSNTDNVEWFQTASSSPTKDLYLLNCVSGTKNLTHYQYVTSTDPNCIGKMLMKKGSEDHLTDFPRYCHSIKCEIKGTSTDRDTESNNCFPKSDYGSKLYCTNKYGETNTYCLTIYDLRADCQDLVNVKDRYDEISTLSPEFKNKVYRYYNQNNSNCTEADMDDCECKSIRCPEGQYVSENICVECTSPEYVNSEGTGCASFFTDQTKYFYIKQGNHYISGKTIKNNIADATIFKITDSEEDAPTVRLESGNDILCIVENSYSSGFGYYYEVSFDGIPGNANDLKLEIINENGNDLEVKIYSDDKFLKSNSINADLTTTTDYEESTCKFTLIFVDECPYRQIYDDNAQCKTCPSGTILKEDGTCEDCGFRKISYDNRCDSCNGDKIKVNNECKSCPPGYVVVNNDCMENADTYNERIENILRNAYNNRCHVDFKHMDSGAILTSISSTQRREWKNETRKDTDPWNNIIDSRGKWKGTAPYLRNSDLTKELFWGEKWGSLDNWGTRHKDRHVMLVGGECCFREYEHPIGTPGGNPNTETCNNGTAWQRSKKHKTLSAVDIWLRSPENYVIGDNRYRKILNPT